MKINFLYFPLLICFLFSGGTAAQENCQPSRHLPNFGCVNADLYRGAQPTGEGIKELARRGVKTIINLRNNDENARLEETRVQSAGMKYINLPLGNWFGPKDDKITEILKQINAPENQPVFIHCKRGADRTGTVIAVYRITHDGWTARQAKSEAKSFNFGWWQFWMNDYINDYYKEFRKQKSGSQKNDVSRSENLFNCEPFCPM